MLLNLATVCGVEDQKAIVACMHDDSNTMAIVGHIHRVEYPLYMQQATLYIIDLLNEGTLTTGIPDEMHALTFVSEKHAFEHVCVHYRDEILSYMNTL